MVKISIIVPVYNVERFLHQCLNSLCQQTLHELEFLVVDDGSTDGSGEICDEYAARDPRIRVFHTENRGLSAARNLGLDLARKSGSEYIGFVDSDDWIESDMFETLYSTAIKYQADVVECGVYSERPDSTEIWVSPEFRVCDSNLENCAHMWKSYYTCVWNKFWRTSCFDGIQFPEGRYYEDEAIILRLINNTRRYCSIQEIMYHYRRNEKSISSQRNMKLVDLWYFRQKNLKFIQEILPQKIDQETYREIEEKHHRLIVDAIGKNFAWWIANPLDEQKRYAPQLREMRNYIRGEIPIRKRGWTRQLRVCSFLCRWDNRVCLYVAYSINQIDRLFRKKKFF